MLGFDFSQSTDEREIGIAEPEIAASASRANAGSPPLVVAGSRRLGRILRSRTFRLLATTVAVVLAFLSRQALARGTPGFPPYVTFFPVIVLAALVGGGMDWNPGDRPFRIVGFLLDFCACWTAFVQRTY